MKRRLPVIGVIGSGTADAATSDLAWEVGRAVGRAGCHLLCGGRGGVMEASCRGHQVGREGLDPPEGVTIGLMPGDDHTEANEFVDIVIPTGIGLARNAIVACGSQALIAIAGGSGTMSEISLAWQMDRPVAALAGSGGWAARLAGARLDDKRGDEIFLAESPDDAIAHILEALSSKTRTIA